MYTHEALGEVFGEAYDVLPNSQKHLLQADVTALHAEDETGQVYPTFKSATRELSRRIGGAANLASYAAVLEAGAKRRGE